MQNVLNTLTIYLINNLNEYIDIVCEIKLPNKKSQKYIRVVYFSKIKVGINTLSFFAERHKGVVNLKLLWVSMFFPYLW